MKAKQIDYETEFYESKDYQQFDEFLPENWDMKYNDMDRIVKQFCPDAKSFLDIGCGRGRAMKRLADLGYEIYGIEPSFKAISENPFKKGNIKQGFFPHISFDCKFDIINLEQVLSHTPNCIEMLQKARELLSPGGIIVIEDPNDYNPLQLLLSKLYGEYWIQPDHVNYFNYSKMDELCKELEFEVLYKTCTYPTELFLFGGNNYFDEEIRQESHERRYEAMKSLGFEERERSRKYWVELGIGRSHRYYVR